MKFPTKFPVAENVPCVLSGVKIIEKDGWMALALIHEYSWHPDRRRDRRGEFKKKFLTDRYFVPLPNVEGYQDRLYKFRRDIGLVLRVLGVDPSSIPGTNDPVEFAKDVVEELKQFMGTEYYLKTRAFFRGKSTLIARRGVFPFMAKEPNLKYMYDENCFRKDKVRITWKPEDDEI